MVLWAVAIIELLLSLSQQACVGSGERVMIFPLLVLHRAFLDREVRGEWGESRFSKKFEEYV